MSWPMTRVLIVDDDADTRLMMRQFLQLEGYEVASAANGLEGLARMRETRPCVVLLDIMMPVMDGFAFREHQLKDPALANVPVLCISAIYSHRDVTSRLGIACLAKPIDPDELLVEVQSRCGRPTVHAPSPA
jgi:CheY-like chemotaxis protein